MLQREEYDDPDEPIGYIGNVGGKEVAYPLKPTRNAESKYKRKWCWECRKSFSSSTNLKEHQMTVHFKEADKFCPYEGCGYKTARISCYQAHIKRIHLKWKDYKCPFDNCDFQAYKLSGIDDHVNKVHKNVKPFACDEEGCQFTALNKSILKSHVRNVHCNIRNFPCAQCKHRAKSKRAIDDHVNAVHLKLKIFQCGSCDFTAATKSTVTNHFKRIHLQVPLKHILHACKFCDYTTDNICNLREHEKGIHLGIKDKKCDECSFTCTALSSLKRHKLIHSGSRPFKCTWLDCTYASNRKAHLQEHIACNHDRQRQFPCPHANCSFSGVTKKKLYEHRRREHHLDFSVTKARSTSATTGPGSASVPAETSTTTTTTVTVQDNQLISINEDEIITATPVETGDAGESVLVVVKPGMPTITLAPVAPLNVANLTPKSEQVVAVARRPPRRKQSHRKI